MSQTVRIEGMEQAAEEVRAAVHLGVLRGLESLGGVIHKQVVENIRAPFNGMPPAVATGNLANSIFFQITPEGLLTRLLVQAGALSDKYADPVNFGARPHLPPVNALLPWVKLKFAVEDEKAALSIAWAIAKSMQKKGMLGRQMFDRAQVQIEPQAPSIVERSIAASLEAAGLNGGGVHVA